MSAVETIIAMRNVIKDIVYLVTDAKGTPLIDRSRKACAVFESFLSEGAVHYRVCGPIPGGKKPSKVEYFTRPSRHDDVAPWETCAGDGCQGEDLRFQEETSTLCAGLKLQTADGAHRDLLVKVTLEGEPV